MEWLEGFETVVFMFDEDEPGRKAAQACAQLLTPGKAKIASLPLKDANEMLLANRLNVPITAISCQDDGIVSQSNLLKWQAVTGEKFELIELSGDHFEILTNPQKFVDIAVAIIKSLSPDK